MKRRSNFNISKTLSYILRHKPQDFGIVLDDQGWANVKEVEAQLNIPFSVLEEIVNDDKKGRYVFNENFSKIRATQGHSIKVDLGLVVSKPPKELFHGTKKETIKDIVNGGGLLKMSRNHVHLSDNIETAKSVATRRFGEDVVLKIDSRKMFDDGVEFYLSENKVWLVDFVPLKYIKNIT